MEEELSNYFFRVSSNVFSFLITDYSFGKPQLEIDNKIGFVKAIFYKKDIAFECILDTNEIDVTCKFANVVRGKIINFYSINSKGERVRDEVSAILRRKGIRERLFTKLNKEIQAKDMIGIVLSDYANMLKKYENYLLINLDKIFE